MKKLLNVALLVSFVVTVMVPLTGIHLHKLASVVFLLLSVIHTAVYREKLGRKKYLLLGLVAVSFASGVFGVILDGILLVMALHKAVSIGAVFFLGIHIFIYEKSCSDKGAP